MILEVQIRGNYSTTVNPTSVITTNELSEFEGFRNKLLTYFKGTSTLLQNYNVEREYLTFSYIVIHSPFHLRKTPLNVVPTTSGS